MADEKKFKMNQQVFWESQSAGVTKKKQGRILAVVDSGKRPDKEMYPSLYKGAGVGMQRNHESYVVGVDAGKTAGSSIRVYWPLVSNLKAA
jgi:hypothetical protein